MRNRVFLLACLVTSPTLAQDPMQAFRHLEPIDAHAHVFQNAPEILGLLKELGLRTLNICVVDPYERGYETVGPQHRVALEVFQASRGLAAWCSTFDPSGWDKAGFSERAIAELDRTFTDGAVAVKIYKTIGMDLQSTSGAYLMPDDPAFDRIFQFIAVRGKTVYAHIAEPIGAWRALDPADPDYSYYRNQPRWHMYGKPGAPSKQEVLAARDRMLARNPRLRVIGCHLGSMEEEVDDIAARLAAYPNFAVDTAARVTHLAIQDQQKVRRFLLDYQDRVLYATDFSLIAGDDPAAAARHWRTTLERDWRYFSTSEDVKFDNRMVRGLALPEAVLVKIFRDNALQWVPGIR